MTAWHTVHVRVSDAATGQPVPVRIRFEAAGRQLAPLGRSLEFPLHKGTDAGGHVEIHGQKWHYIDGSCEIPLPPGEIVVEVSRGPEYRAARHVVNLAPGGISLRLAIERWTDLRRDGWYSGDTRVLDLSPHAALLEAAGEDVAVVNLLVHQQAEQSGPVHNLLAFSGQQPCLQRDGHLVAVNSLNQHAELGSLSLLNCHRPVFPLRTGDAGLDDWTLADWCDQCHRKKTGLVLWSDEGKGVFERCRSEALADAVLGKIDAFEVLDKQELGEVFAEIMLGARGLPCAGLRLPLAAGSGKHSARQTVGSLRTYANLGAGQPLDFAAWIEAVRAGHTFVTNGPLLRFTLAGQGPGGVVRAEAGQRLHLRAEARAARPVETLDVAFNAMPLPLRCTATDDGGLVIDEELEVTESGSLVASCNGGDDPLSGRFELAHTSPIWLEVRGRPFKAHRNVLEKQIGQLERFLTWTRNPPRRAANARPERLAEVLTAARDLLVQRTREA